MSKHLRFLILAAASLGVLAAQAKVAIINSQQAVFGTAEFKKWKTDAETRFKPRQDQLQKLQKDLADIQAQLQGGKLNQQGEQELTAQGQRKQREGQRMQQDYQEDLDREQNDVLARMGGRMREVVSKLAESKGVDVVMDAANLVYFKPALDLTAEAMAAYDKAYPLK
ncbi:MAG: OmpH family outer membrane protein [Bryobacteraceae bacterium]